MFWESYEENKVTEISPYNSPCEGQPVFKIAFVSDLYRDGEMLPKYIYTPVLFGYALLAPSANQREDFL
jgi:hypothetical protein